MIVQNESQKNWMQKKNISLKVWSVSQSTDNEKCKRFSHSDWWKSEQIHRVQMKHPYLSYVDRSQRSVGGFNEMMFVRQQNLSWLHSKSA